MRLIQCGWMLALFVPLSVGVAGSQALDRNAQRIVNDATRDLKSNDVQRRVDAIDNLASWGKLTTAPLIIGALKDPDARVRAAAADALWDDDMTTETARASLTAALNDPAPEVAVLAAGALPVLGASRADVRQANERGLSSTDLRIRFLAARGLIGLASPAGLVTPLVQYLERQSAGDARNNVELAEEALEELRDTKDRSIVAPLMDAIPKMSSGGQIVMKVLGEVQPRPNGWTAMLVAQAGRTDAALRRQSMLLMRDVKADADVAQWSPAAARMLSTDPDDVVRSYAASALQFAGGAASAHADAVLAAAGRDRSAAVRESAFDALVEMIGRAGTSPMAVKTTMATSALPMIQADRHGSRDGRQGECCRSARRVGVRACAIGLAAGWRRGEDDAALAGRGETLHGLRDHRELRVRTENHAVFDDSLWSSLSPRSPGVLFATGC